MKKRTIVVLVLSVVVLGLGMSLFAVKVKAQGPCQPPYWISGTLAQYSCRECKGTISWLVGKKVQVKRPGSSTWSDLPDTTRGGGIWWWVPDGGTGTYWFKGKTFMSAQTPCGPCDSVSAYFDNTWCVQTSTIHMQGVVMCD